MFNNYADFIVKASGDHYKYDGQTYSTLSEAIGERDREVAWYRAELKKESQGK